MNEMTVAKDKDRAVEGKSRGLTVRVPGSTSNIGPGFDTLGLALEIYNIMTFELLEQGQSVKEPIIARGDISKQLPLDKSNLIYTTLTKLWQDRPELLSRVQITVASEIPLNGGLGSSASAIVGTVWAASVLAGESIGRNEMLARATRLEGHPDNVAPSLFGGFVVCGHGERGRILVERLEWPEDWCTLVVAPPYTVPTTKARALLPRSVPRSDAVSNVQNVALLLSAVLKKNEEAMRSALHDHLHEPYRLPLVPDLAELRARLRDLPALGCVLSGAGSSVLVVVARRHKKQILEFLKDWAAGRKETTQVLDLRVAQKGIEVLG
jgi:homoserine kinase